MFIYNNTNINNISTKITKKRKIHKGGGYSGKRRLKKLTKVNKVFLKSLGFKVKQ